MRMGTRAQLCFALGTSFLPRSRTALVAGRRCLSAHRRALPYAMPTHSISMSAARSLVTRRNLVPGRPEDFPEMKETIQVHEGNPHDLREPEVDEDGKVYLKSMSFKELERWVVETLRDKKYRAKQLWSWMYKEERYASSFEEMTDLSKAFRTRLEDAARIDSLAIERVHQSEDGTRKIIFRLPSGDLTESVLIPSSGRSTLCFSSQKGCAFNCQFCYTGRGGFSGNLTHGEIVDQIVLSKRFFEKEGRITNLVAMGQGEPFANYDNLMRALNVVLDKDGLDMSHNKVTVSTVGLVPEIRRFCRESKVNLAVSLHSGNDKVRSWIMPVNRKYALPELMGALRDEFPRDLARQSKVFFEYVMLKGVNDSLQDAKELLRLVSGVPCKINLIQFNPHDGTSFDASPAETMYAFQDYLVKKGMTVTIRQSRGEDKMMACGQLGKDGPVRAPRMKVPEQFQHAVRDTREVAGL